jgi:hypothetical protein
MTGRVRVRAAGATLATAAALLLLLLWLQGIGHGASAGSALAPWSAPPSGSRGDAGGSAMAPVQRTASDPAPLVPRASANATGNLSASLGRLVLLVSLAAGAVITLAWSRVAVSWFSHDASKKVQAKERARDAMVGSLILVAAVSGLAWGLTQWVLTGV